MQTAFRFSAALCLVLAACNDPGKATPGAARLAVSMKSVDAGITQVKVTVSGAGLDAAREQDLELSDGAWHGLVQDLPLGNKHFVAEAFDSSGLVLTGAADAEILANTTALVSIVLQQVTPPPGFDNHAPAVTGLTATDSAPKPAVPVGLSATATDADGDALTYAWTASAGTISGDGAAAQWITPPTPGPVVLTVTVDDGRGASDSLSVTITVIPDTGNADVNAYLNYTPQIIALTAAPSRLGAGESTQLTMAVVNLDGDAMAFAWTTDCNGAFDDAAAQSPKFTLASVPASGTCALSVSIKDAHGASTAGRLTINAGGACSGTAAVDQSNLAMADPNSTVQTLRAGEVWAQTFTAGLSGALVQARLAVSPGSDFQGAVGGSITVSVRDTTAGTAGVSNGYDYFPAARTVPDGGDLAAESLSLSGSVATIDFAQPATLLAGHTYALVVRVDSGAVNWPLAFGYNADPYAAGSIYFTAGNGWDDYGYQPELTQRGGVDYMDGTFETTVNPCR